MAQKVRFGDRHIPLPGSRILRMAIGIVLVIFGIFGFLPVLGFWMIPFGLLVLSVDVPIVRRWRRQLTVWWHRRKEEKAKDADRVARAGSERRRAKRASRHMSEPHESDRRAKQPAEPL